MRKIDLIIESIRDEYMINLLEEGTTSELETLKTKKFLNENLNRIRKMLIEEGAIEGVQRHLGDNWGKYLAEVSIEESGLARRIRRNQARAAQAGAPSQPTPGAPSQPTPGAPSQPMPSTPNATATALGQMGGASTIDPAQAQAQAREFQSRNIDRGTSADDVAARMGALSGGSIGALGVGAGTLGLGLGSLATGEDDPVQDTMDGMKQIGDNFVDDTGNVFSSAGEMIGNLSEMVG